MSAYTFQAEILCPACAPGEIIRIAPDRGYDIPSELAIAALDCARMSVSSRLTEDLADTLIRRVAEIMSVDVNNSCSFDSDDFPKWAPNVENDEESCAVCNRLFDGTDATLAERIARATGIQETLESLQAELSSEINAESIYADTFDVTPTWEHMGRIAAELIGSALDAARADGDLSGWSPERVPSNYLGTQLSL